MCDTYNPHDYAIILAYILLKMLEGTIMELKLVDNWRNCKTWISSWCFNIVAALSAGWNTLPSEWKPLIPVNYLLYVIIFFCVIGFIGRLIKQPEKNASESNP